MRDAKRRFFASKFNYMKEKKKLFNRSIVGNVQSNLLLLVSILKFIIKTKIDLISFFRLSIFKLKWEAKNYHSTWRLLYVCFILNLSFAFSLFYFFTDLNCIYIWTWNNAVKNKFRQILFYLQYIKYIFLIYSFKNCLFGD